MRLTCESSAVCLTPRPNILTVQYLASIIDHAVLNPEYDRNEIDTQLAAATEMKVYSVFVPTSTTRYAAHKLAGTGVIVGAPIGFPHGSSSTAAKLAEVRQAIDDGAMELDVVQQIGWVRTGLYSAVGDEISSIVEAAGGRVVKVILETAYLNDEQIAKSAAVAEQAGADFVKSSTGFAGAGATIHNLRIMRESVSARIQLKASSGVRSLDTVLEMMRVGVTRFGMSATRKILDELAERNARGDVIAIAPPRGYSPSDSG